MSIKRQHNFPQRIGALIEAHIIKKEKLTYNKRQRIFGYYDAYDANDVYEVKAAKDKNYFKMNLANHKKLCKADGWYILVRYSLCNEDKELRLITDINIDSTQKVSAKNLKDEAYNCYIDKPRPPRESTYFRVLLKE